MDEIIGEFIEEIHKFGKKRRNSVTEISKSEMDILFYLKRNEKEYLNPSDLSTFLGLSRPSITILLNEMEAKEYITRMADTVDKRKMKIVIANKGNEILKKYFSRFYGNLREAMLYIGEEDAKELLRIIRKINER